MPPKLQFQEGEKVLCFHGPLIYGAKCLKSHVTEEEQVKYLIHYAGWNKNWDEWVLEDRVLKFNDTNLQKKLELQRAHLNQKLSQKSRKTSTATKAQGRKEEGSREKDSESRASTSVANVEKGTGLSEKNNSGSLASTSHGSIAEAPRERRRRLEASREAGKFVVKVEFKIIVPHDLKFLLVEESEVVTQNRKLPSLPMRITVEKILNNYVEFQETVDMTAASREGTLEVAKGIREYFNRTLSLKLLYKWEKLQYEDITRENPDSLPSQLYGAFHLLRLFMKLGDMLSYVQMDERSIHLLSSRFHDFLQYLLKNKENLFNLQQDYIDSSLDYQRRNSQS